MERLPVLRDLVICKNVASHDKKGGNDNGFSNKAEFVRRGPGLKVVSLDVAGPGCVYSSSALWMCHPILHPKFVENAQTKLLGQVKYFFDRKNKPGIDLLLRDMIGTPPFTYPLAFNTEQSAGANVSYVPIPFQDGLTVTVDGGRSPMFSFEFYFHLFPHGSKVPAWAEDRDLSAARSSFDPESAWAPAGRETHEKNDLTIRPGETADVFASDRGGTVKCIRMQLPRDDRALRDLWLKAWWDDDKAPSLQSPLSILFAIENRFSEKEAAIKENAEMRGVIVGEDKDGLFFLRLPMPYANKARLVVENQGQVARSIAKVRIEFDEGAPPGLGKSAGYLRAQFRESRDLTPGRAYVLLEAKGRGKIVGTVLAVEDTHETFLEGDTRIYVDGSRSPSIKGEATETYFYGNWYFLESAYALPVHGAPTFRMRTENFGDLSDVTMYRFHPTDFVPFRSEVRYTVQHGGFNEVPGNYRSLVFYYHLPEPSLSRTDYLNMSDAEDLLTHGYSGAWVMAIDREGFFEGEKNGQDLGLKKRPSWISPMSWIAWLTGVGIFHDPPEDSPDKVTFAVAEHDGPYEFKAKIDPEAQAVMLRRVLDQSVFDQRARIEVDGQPAGTWFNTGNNQWKIFAEDDLILDPATTEGKEKITIRVTPESKTFTAAEYTVFSIVTAPND
ncbi:MAG: hypothetical protein A2V67_00545 [Deltaproteobacteria bacterium RBG_13_61_14]|nr:MAG: hypothetical protein A2V67_00545 [Deltaproteobacteria bacterium RBG_13_61_14]